MPMATPRKLGLGFRKKLIRHYSALPRKFASDQHVAQQVRESPGRRRESSTRPGWPVSYSSNKYVQGFHVLRSTEKEKKRKVKIQESVIR